MSNRKRLSKRAVAKGRATKVVITPRKYEKPILVKENTPKLREEDVEFMTLSKGMKINKDVFLV